MWRPSPASDLHREPHSHASFRLTVLVLYLVSWFLRGTRRTVQLWCRFGSQQRPGSTELDSRRATGNLPQGNLPSGGSYR